MKMLHKLVAQGNLQEEMVGIRFLMPLKLFLGFLDPFSICYALWNSGDW